MNATQGKQMKSNDCMIKIRQLYFRICMVSCAALVLLTIGLSESSAEMALQSKSEQERLRLGERMYREGLLPSGETMRGHIREDVSVDSTAFSCESCHMRGGLVQLKVALPLLQQPGPNCFNHITKVPYSQPLQSRHEINMSLIRLAGPPTLQRSLRMRYATV